MAGTAWTAFVANTKARASQVNENFDWIEGSIVPMNAGSKTDAVYDLGESGNRWKDIHLSGNAEIGTVSLGTSTNTVLFVGGTLRPETDASYDLGESVNMWKNLYLSGNAGIGVTSPTRPLEISKSGVGDVPLASFLNPNTGSNAVAQIHVGKSVGSFDDNLVIAYKQDSNYGYLVIDGDPGGVSLNIANGGDVGIGEVSPASKLDVNGTFQVQNGTSINEISIDGTLAGNSDDAVPTEKAVKTYIDNATLAGTIATSEVSATTAFPFTAASQLPLSISSANNRSFMLTGNVNLLFAGDLAKVYIALVGTTGSLATNASILPGSYREFTLQGQSSGSYMVASTIGKSTPGTSGAYTFYLIYIHTGTAGELVVRTSVNAIEVN